MNAGDVIGYAYDADLHCESCTRKRFPDADDEFSDVQDSEGNDIHPVFAGEEHDPAGEYCGDCFAEIWERNDDDDDDERTEDDE